MAAIGDHAQVEPYVKVDDVTRRRARAFGGTHIVCVQGQIAGARPSRSYLSTREIPRSLSDGENPCEQTLFSTMNTQPPTAQGARGPAMSLCSGASLASQACGVGGGRLGPQRFLCSQVTDCVAVAMRSSVGAPSMLLHVLALSLVGRVHAMAISTPGNRACAFSQSTSMPRPSLRLLVT